MPKANDRIGPYQLISKLGEGGFGEVWLAQDSSGSSSRAVALKIPLKSEIDLDGLLQEATLWARATGHPNVLEFLAARAFDGQVVLVSEYAPDGSLEDWLERSNGRAPSVEAAVEMRAALRPPTIKEDYVPQPPPQPPPPKRLPPPPPLKKLSPALKWGAGLAAVVIALVTYLITKTPSTSLHPTNGWLSLVKWRRLKSPGAARGFVGLGCRVCSLRPPW